MIEINLLPGAGRKKAARAKAIDVGAIAAGLGGRLRDKFLIGAVVAVVAALGAVGGLYGVQTARAASLDAHREQALADSSRYANFLKDRARAEAARDTLLRQVNVIRSIDEDRYVWPHVLDEISRALPQYTWLTAVGFTGTPQGSNNVVLSPKDSAAAKKKGAKKGEAARLNPVVPRDVITIRLTGRTVDIQAITRFWRDLEASPFFANVQLDKSELAVDQGKEVAQFQLTMGYSRPDTALLNRVPLTLSVR